ILGAQASKRSRRQELLAGVFYSWDTGPWFGGFGMPARLARPKRGALLYGRAEHARRYSARRWYSFGPLFEQSLDRGRGQASLLARLHRVFFNQSTERRSVGRHSLTPHNHFEQRVGDGFVVGQRQQVGREIKCDSYSRAGFDLPHQHDQRISGRGLCRLFVDFAGKRHTRAVRALRVPFEPLAVVTGPRTTVQHAVGVIEDPVDRSLVVGVGRGYVAVLAGRPLLVEASHAEVLVLADQHHVELLPPLHHAILEAFRWRRGRRWRYTQVWDAEPFAR